MPSASPSSALTLTLELAGPSGKEQSKVFGLASPSAVSLPAAPQSLVTATVSAPGSEREREEWGVSPSLAESGPERVIWGATSATATSISSVAMPPASPSSALTLTLELAGPSGKEQSKVFGLASPSAVSLPAAPQSLVTATVSAPGSVTV